MNGVIAVTLQATIVCIVIIQIGFSKKLNPVHAHYVNVCLWK